MKKCILILSALGLLGATLNGQSLPAEIYVSEDGRMLLTGGKPSVGLYDSALIRNVYLQFPQTNFWNVLTSNYASQTEIQASMTVDGILYDSVGVRLRGNTSYQSTGQSQKKSFKISLDYANPDRRIMGYRSMKLNNEAGDPSFLREVFYLHQIRKHVPAAKANFVHLYLNNQDWGVYPNIQLLNKDYLKEWFLSNNGTNWRADDPTPSPPGPGGGGGPQWGDGTTALNYLGADTGLYQEYYTLKSSDMPDGWSNLVAGCNALNNTPSADLPNILPNYLDVDRALWFLASEIAFSDDDSYIMKGKMDYFVYFDKETGRLSPLEYDGNSVLQSNNIAWPPFYNVNKVNYPLLNKLLNVPAWRQRYLAHLRTIIAEELDAAGAVQVIDQYKNQIDALYQSDPKKYYTYAQFNTGVSDLKNLVNTRRTNLLANAEVAQQAPQIGNVTYFNPAGQPWTAPNSQEAVSVQAQVSSGNGISKVNLYYAEGILGGFTSIQMFDDGAHQDGASGDGIFGASIPAFDAGSWIRFYIEALADNTPKSAAYKPAGAEHNVYYYRVKQSLSPVSGIVINEFMASNTTTVSDESGQYDDWIELHNTNTFPVNLGGFFLSDNPAIPGKWEIPQGTVIPGGGYLIFWADENQPQGANHTNFKLSASDGEFLSLTDTHKDIVDSLSFSVQTTDLSYSRIPNGTGPFIIKEPTFAGNNQPHADIENNTSAFSWLMFPNPAQSTVHLLMPDLAEKCQLRICDAVGRVICERHISGSLQLNIENWPSGIYFVSLGQRAERLVVSH
jgi:hypothetical protein